MEKDDKYRLPVQRAGQISTLVALLLICLMLAACGGRLTPQAPRVGETALPEQWETPLDSGETATLPAGCKLSDIIEESAELDALICEALVNNPTLVTSALSVKEAELTLKKTRGDRLPTVDATLSAGRKDPGAGSSSDSYSLGMAVSWEVDLWGRLADLENVAELNMEALNSDFEYARNSIAGKVIQAWINLIGYKKLVEIEEKRLKSYTDNQEIILDQYKAGLGTLEDLEAARTGMADAAATLAERRQVLAEARRTLQLLLGTNVLQELALPDDLPSTRLPVAGLPAATLGQRPDLKSAYQAILARDSNSRAAYKALLPDFSISFNVSGQSSASAADMLKGSAVWSLLGNMTAPLFHGKKLKTQAELAELGAEKAYWSYRDVLLKAVVEVENALSRETSLADREEHMKKALVHAENNRRHYELKYRRGLTDILNMLSAQQTAFSTEISLLDIQIKRLVNRISLGMALGLGI